MCPNCDTQISKDTLIRDKAIEKEIFKMLIQCANDGCDLICAWKDLRNHLEFCVYRKEQCEKCQQTFIHNMKEKHLTDLCQKMIIRCNECGLEMIREDLETKHKNIEMELDQLCGNLKGPCPYKCDNGDIIYSNIRSHLMECVRKLINCPLFDLGCAVTATFKDISKHLETHSFQHQILMMNEINRTKNENDDLHKLFKATTETMMQEMKILKEINQKFIITVDQLTSREMENSKTLENLKSEIEQYKQSISSQPINDDNGRISIVDDQWEWTIRDIRQKCMEARNGGQKQIISESFYISRPGYRMCMKIYPNGDGRGFGECLSVYFVILKGEYDDEILWPFRHQITMSIVSSRDTIRNVTIHMKPDNIASCYGKPINSNNVGAGQPEFIKLSELLNRDNYTHGGSLKVKLKVTFKS